MSKISLKESITDHLDLAINSFFRDKYSIAVHTLIHAALESLRASGKSKGIKSIVKDPEALGVRFDQDKLSKAYKELIPESRWKGKTNDLIIKEMTEVVYNFSKHGRKDLNSSIKFHKGLNEIVLSDAIEMYKKLTGNMTVPMMIFQCWFVQNQGEKILHDEFKSQILLVVEKLDLKDKSKKDFLDKLELYSRLGINTFEDAKNKVI